MFKNKININLINSNNFAGLPFILPKMGMPQQNQMMNSNGYGQIVNPYIMQANKPKTTTKPKKEEKSVKPNSMLNYIYGGQV
jgi:hypothetical protein